MAGVKRKHEATQASATAPSGHSHAGVGASQSATNANVDDTSNIRVTRSLRSSRDARASQNDVRAHSTTTATGGNSNINSRHNTSRPSRIITLSTRAARANTAQENAARENAVRENVARENTTRETRNTRTRSSAQLSTTQTDAPAPLPTVPETPRHKRIKRGPAVEETPRTTRQSARLRAHAHPTSIEEGSNDMAVIPKMPEPSPSVTAAPSSRTRNRSRQFADNLIDTTDNATSAAPVVKSPSPDRATPVPSEDLKPVEEEPLQSPEPESSQPTKEESPKGTVVDEDKNGISGPAVAETADPLPFTTTPSPDAYQNRKSPEPGDTGPAEIESVSESPSRKPKLEEGELDRALEQQLQNGTGGKPDSHSPAEAVAEPRLDDESRQVTEEVEGSTPEVATESTVSKAVRGGRTRGRGRGGRSRGSARFTTNKRGRGAARSSRGGRTGRQLDRSSDVEPDRSPSPSAATQKLRDRQRELDKAFKKVAAAQRLALAVLATQSEKRLARDKNAHKNVPEFEEINMQLKERLRGRKEVLRREYELKVEQENRIFEANKQAIEERYRAQGRNIREEHLLASQGAYMTFVEGRRAAEDDEHTETDDSETEPDRGRVVPPAREVFRGFNSNFVRNPAGAAAYDRAYFGWDDFVQRAKVGDDIDPQMKEIRDAGPFAGMTAEQILDMLVKATGVVEVPRNSVPAERNPPMLPDLRPRALSTLADVAAAEPPRPPLSQAAPRLSTHRTILPQPQPAQPPLPHGPPEPRPFVLPPPTPQRQQPRRLLPAGQQIPPINEQLGLPDPFAAMGGPPHLPPPAGSNFHRPPLPGYLTGHHPPSIYYPPPPPPPPGPRPPF